MEILSLITVCLLGALAAILANRSIAVFNDGLRPIVGQYKDGQISRKALAALSFSISIGLVVGFGIPVSIGATIILIHSILLGTDIIGTWAPNTKQGIIISGIVGAIYGLLIVVGLEFVVSGIEKLPYNFLNELGMIGNPIVLAFAVFPAIAVATQHGFKKGTITFTVEMLVLFATFFFGKIEVSETVTITLSKEGMTLLAGMMMLLYYSIKIESEGDSNQKLVQIFESKVNEINSNKWLLAVMGGLVASATSLLLVAGDLVSLNLLSEGNNAEAAIAVFARALGIIPLVFTTAIVSGVYGPVGTTLVFFAGIVAIGNPILAFGLGFIIIVIEILLLAKAAKGMDKFPGVKDMGEGIRSSMNKVLELALIIGGAIACHAIAAEFGYFWLIGIYALNEFSPKPIVKLAVGPLAAILLGIIMNILVVIGLYVQPEVGLI